MTDLSAFGPTHELGLSSGERREVVMVHVPLEPSSEGVEHLLHLQHLEGGQVEDLGLTPLEQP